VRGSRPSWIERASWSSSSSRRRSTASCASATLRIRSEATAASEVSSSRSSSENGRTKARESSEIIPSGPSSSNSGAAIRLRTPDIRIEAAVPNFESAATSQTSADCFFSTTSSSSVRDTRLSPIEPAGRRETALRYSPGPVRSTRIPSSGCNASNALSMISCRSSSSFIDLASAWWTSFRSSSRAARRFSISVSCCAEISPESDSRSSESALL
jgi:hypothetical protein